MERQLQKTREEIGTTERLFAKWLEDTKNLCMAAVFLKQDDVIYSLKEVLVG